MRRALLSSVILVTFVMLAGCSVNHDFTFTIDKTFTVNSSTLTSFSLMQIIDPTSNSTFNDNKDKISAINVTSATYTITRVGVNAPAKTLSASLQAADATGMSPAMLVPMTPFTNLTVGSTGSFTVDNTVANQLGNWLKNSPNKAQVTLQANTNAAPTDYDVQITLQISATYTVNPLSFL